MTALKVVETTLADDLGDSDHARYAAQLVGRTMKHLDKVQVDGLVDQVLLDRSFSTYDYWELEQARLLLTSLAESVLDEASKTLRMRMALDVASTLLPRLNKKVSK